MDTTELLRQRLQRQKQALDAAIAALRAGGAGQAGPAAAGVHSAPSDGAQQPATALQDGSSRREGDQDADPDDREEGGEAARPTTDPAAAPTGGGHAVPPAEAQAGARPRDPIPRGGADTVAVLRRLLAEDPAAAFARADVDGSGNLTLHEWERAFGADEGVDADVLRALFHDFDADQDGCVSVAEFEAGLQAVRPPASGLDVLRGIVRDLDLEERVVSHLALLYQQRRPADERELPIDDAAIAAHSKPGDMHTVWQGGLSNEVTRALETQVRQLRLQLQQGAALDAAQMNAKFAESTFEGDYGNLQEHLDGAEKKIGLPAPKIYDGMEMQLCGAGDSQKPFPVPNNGVKEAIPAEEWEYVVKPDLSKVYPGGRRGVLLDVYLVAHGAAQRDDGARLDMPLDAAALGEVAERNACSTDELVDSVKTVALRSGKTSFLSEAPLERGIKRLTSESIADEHSAVIAGLEALLKLGTRTLKELRKQLGEALEKAARVETTGERSFAAVAESVKDLASREMLEALVWYARSNLMEAKVCEEEIIGLRLYTGAIHPGLLARSHSLPLARTHAVRASPHFVFVWAFLSQARALAHSNTLARTHLHALQK